MNQIQISQDKILAAKIRIHVLEMTRHFGSGHVGGSLSVADTLAVLYNDLMTYDPARPEMEDRDVLVLSKGHAGPALYSVLAEKGFFDPSLLMTLNQGGTSLPSHPDRLKTPGVDMTTGSLGQGTSTAVGMALGMKKKGLNRHVFCMVGDGELNEGQCWEAFQFIAARNLHNCIVLIDWNKRQLDGYTQDILCPFSIEEKMQAFGFHAVTIDGSSTEAIYEALQEAVTRTDQPSCIVLDTIKGQGVPYFEEMLNNHSVRFNNETTLQETAKAIETLQACIKQEESLCFPL